MSVREQIYVPDAFLTRPLLACLRKCQCQGNQASLTRPFLACLQNCQCQGNQASLTRPLLACFKSASVRGIRLGEGYTVMMHLLYISRTYWNYSQELIQIADTSIQQSYNTYIYTRKKKRVSKRGMISSSICTLHVYNIHITCI